MLCFILFIILISPHYTPIGAQPVTCNMNKTQIQQMTESYNEFLSCFIGAVKYTIDGFPPLERNSSSDVDKYKSENSEKLHSDLDDKSQPVTDESPSTGSGQPRMVRSPVLPGQIKGELLQTSPGQRADPLVFYDSDEQVFGQLASSGSGQQIHGQSLHYGPASGQRWIAQSYDDPDEQMFGQSSSSNFGQQRPGQFSRYGPRRYSFDRSLMTGQQRVSPSSVYDLAQQRFGQSSSSSIGQQRFGQSRYGPGRYRYGQSSITGQQRVNQPPIYDPDDQMFGQLSSSSFGQQSLGQSFDYGQGLGQQRVGQSSYDDFDEQMLVQSPPHSYGQQIIGHSTRYGQYSQSSITGQQMIDQPLYYDYNEQMFGQEARSSSDQHPNVNHHSTNGISQQTSDLNRYSLPETIILKPVHRTNMIQNLPPALPPSSGSGISQRHVVIWPSTESKKCRMKTTDCLSTMSFSNFVSPVTSRASMCRRIPVELSILNFVASINQPCHNRSGLDGVIMNDFFKLMSFSLNTFSNFVAIDGVSCIKAVRDKITACVRSIVGGYRDFLEPHQQLWSIGNPRFERQSCQDTLSLKLCTLQAMRDQGDSCTSPGMPVFVGSLFDFMLERCIALNVSTTGTTEPAGADDDYDDELSNVSSDPPAKAMLDMPTPAPTANPEDHTSDTLIIVILSLVVVSMVYTVVCDCCAHAPCRRKKKTRQMPPVSADNDACQASEDHRL